MRKKKDQPPVDEQPSGEIVRRRGRRPGNLGESPTFKGDLSRMNAKQESILRKRQALLAQVADLDRQLPPAPAPAEAVPVNPMPSKAGKGSKTGPMKQLAPPDTPGALLDRTARIYTIYHKLVYEAKSFTTIADEMGIAVDSIVPYIKEACEFMNAEILAMKESFLSMVLLQANLIQGRQLPAILNSPVDIGPSSAQIQNWVMVTNVQLRLFEMMTGQKGGQLTVNVQNNLFSQTMTGNSPLYKRGLDEMWAGKNIPEEELLTIKGNVQRVAEVVGVDDDDDDAFDD